MASATRKTVEKTVTEDVIVLELTQEEAEALTGLLYRQGEGHSLNSIHNALTEPAEATDRPIEVGDKVRVTEVGEGDSIFLHRVGNVIEIDSGDPILTFLVDVGNDDWAWVKSVERVND